MPDAPHLDVLDRDRASQEVAQRYADGANLLAEHVDYGTNLLVRCFGQRQAEIRDAVAIGTFGRKVVSALDSVEQLVRSGSGEGARVVARSLLEASLYGEWVLGGSRDDRAIAYYVANLRWELLWSRRALDGTPENDRYKLSMGARYNDILAGDTGRIAEVKARIQEVEDHLGKDRFKGVNAEFERVYAKRKYDPKWHDVAGAGAGSVRAIAEQLDRMAEYVVFYDVYSGETHSGDYKSHIRLADGNLILLPVRGMNSVGDVIVNSTTFTLQSYRVLLDEYRPGERQAFERKFEAEWKQRYQSVPDVDVSFRGRQRP